MSVHGRLKAKGITHRRNISQLILLTGQDLSQNSSHNLSTSRLGQIWHDKNGLGSRKRTDALAHLKDEIFSELVIDLIAILNGHKGIDGLARELIAHPDHGRFCDGVVLDEGGFDFGSGETVTANVDDIVDSASDPVVTLVITARAVPRELERVSTARRETDRKKLT